MNKPKEWKPHVRRAEKEAAVRLNPWRLWAVVAPACPNSLWGLRERQPLHHLRHSFLFLEYTTKCYPWRIHLLSTRGRWNVPDIRRINYLVIIYWFRNDSHYKQHLRRAAVTASGLSEAFQMLVKIKCLRLWITESYMALKWSWAKYQISEVKVREDNSVSQAVSWRLC